MRTVNELAQRLSTLAWWSAVRDCCRTGRREGVDINVILASSLPCGVVRGISLTSEGRQHEGRSSVGLVRCRGKLHRLIDSPALPAGRGAVSRVRLCSMLVNRMCMYRRRIYVTLCIRPHLLPVAYDYYSVSDERRRYTRRRGVPGERDALAARRRRAGRWRHSRIGRRDAVVDERRPEALFAAPSAGDAGATVGMPARRLATRHSAKSPRVSRSSRATT